MLLNGTSRSVSQSVTHLGSFSQDCLIITKILAKLYIYIIYTPYLGFGIACPGREREQGRFKGEHRGSKGAQQGSTERERGSIEGAEGSTGAAEREHEVVQGRSRWEPEMASSISV